MILSPSRTILRAWLKDVCRVSAGRTDPTRPSCCLAGCLPDERQRGSATASPDTHLCAASGRRRSGKRPGRGCPRSRPQIRRTASHGDAPCLRSVTSTEEGESAGESSSKQVVPYEWRGLQVFRITSQSHKLSNSLTFDRR